MFRVAVRSAARAAFKPSPSVAVRALSTTHARLSGFPAPPMFGPGAKPGEVPTEENQSTGLERAQVLAEREGFPLFDEKPLDSSRIGTLEDPIKVISFVRPAQIPRPLQWADRRYYRTAAVSLVALVAPRSRTSSSG